MATVNGILESALYGQVLLLFRKTSTRDPLMLENGEIIPAHDGEMDNWRRRLNDGGWQNY